MFLSVALLRGHQITELVLRRAGNGGSAGTSRRGTEELVKKCVFLWSSNRHVSLWIRGLYGVQGRLSFEKGRIQGSVGMKVVHILLAGMKVIPFPFWEIRKTETKTPSLQGYVQSPGLAEITQRVSVEVGKYIWRSEMGLATGGLCAPGN